MLSADSSIRPVTVAEAAELAAQITMQTREAQPNPFAGTVNEQRWRSVYDRVLFELSAAECTEGGA